ncbi:MAG: CBS domain-containing protein, partial [Candidatus Hydrothermarchaeales archaeon]
SKNLVVINENGTIDDLLKLYHKYHYHSFPVVNKKRELLGIVTENVILIRVLFNSLSSKEFSNMIGRADIKNIEKYTTKEIKYIMSHAINVSPDTKLEDAVALMVRHSISRLCVIEGRKLVGIISRRDILRKIGDVT